MDYLKNHCWCSSSHWDKQNFDCQIIVNISSYEDYNVEDWQNLFTTEKYFSQSRYEEAKEMFSGEEYYTEDFFKSYAVKTINILKEDVYQWLADNIPDDRYGNKMWCLGSKEYRATDSCSSFSFFFQRRKDAMKFIKTWSKYKNPVHYCQYFTDVRKKLNLETMKYETI